MMQSRLRKHWLPLLALLLALFCAFCLWRMSAVSRLLVSQQAAQRWQNGSEQRFAQVSCFLPGGETLKREQIHTFRNDMAQKLQAASFDVKKNPGLLNDAWCGFGSVKVSSDRRSGECSVVAVGGSFFDFHPLRLLSGNYLSASDLMEDRVLLDREAAWLLFGGTELSGMQFSVNGVPFVVAGVYAHEKDAFSRLAFGDGMCIYMSYDAYEKLFPEKSAINCYELVMAEPVKGFAYNAVQEKFPVKGTEFVSNSIRFEPDRLWKLAISRADRSMHRGSTVYPYWENAARAAEDRASRWLLTAVASGSLPLALMVYAFIRLFLRSREKLEDELLPDARDRIEEAYRVRARRRWEKKHPDRH